MNEKSLHLYLILIIFIIFIEHISGQTRVGHLRGLRAFSESIITTSINREKNESSDDPIFTTNLEESSYPSDYTTEYKIINITYPTYLDPTPIGSTMKASDIIPPSSSSEEIFTHNTIPESTEYTTSSFSDAPPTEPTTSFNQNTTIPTTNPSTGIENSSTQTTDIPFSTNPTEYTSIPSFETIPTLPSNINTQDITSIPTIPSIPTTPSTHSSDSPKIQTTLIYPTNNETIPTVPTTSSSQLNLTYSSDSPKILTTLVNPTNNETIPTVPTTIPDIENTTSSTTTPIPPINSNLVLTGFSHYNQYDSNISFYIYFSLMEGYIYSNNLKFPVEITYNTNLRFLQNNEANCNLEKIENQKVTYLCEIETENQNINNIKIFPEFHFNSQTANVTISSLSNQYINNLQKIGNQFDSFIDSNFYMLIQSKINKGNNKDKIFNITGIINEPLPKFQKINLVLKAIIEKGSDNVTTDINCNVIDINKNNYIIQCRVYDDKVYALQNSISFIDKEILLINFDKYSDSIVQFPDEDDLDAASVIAIIIIIIFFGFFI